MNINNNHIYVIFGASGDLTKRKLVPAVYSLFVQNLLPEKFALLGVSRTEYSDDEFRSNMKSSIKEFKEIDDETKIDDFINNIFYTPINFDNVASYQNLKEEITEAKDKYQYKRKYNILFINTAKFIWNNSSKSCSSWIK